MIVFIDSLKRLLKNKVQIAMLLIVPFIAIIPVALNVNTGIKNFNVGIVDHDNTRFSETFIHNMKENMNIYKINESDVKNDLNNSKFDYVLVIPKNYTYDIINLKKIKIMGYEKKNSDYSKIIGGLINSFISPAENIAKMSHGSSRAFYEGIKKIPEFKLSGKFTRNESIMVVVWGMVIQFIMISSIFTSTLILTDKENKTFYRSLSTSISLKNYIFQTILSFIFISFIQILVLTFAMVHGFGIYPGKSILYMIGLLTLMSLVSVSLGTAVSTVSSSITKAVMFGIGTVMIMGMFGGCWGMMPSNDAARNISKILPTTWAMEAVKKILNNNNAVCKELIILLAFSAVFFMLGTWKKSDIIK